MTINDALACGNAPHSSADSSELARGLTRKFEQELSGMVEKTTAETMTPLRFRALVSGLHELLMKAGREIVERLVEEVDEPRASIEVQGERLRYRGSSTREWLSPFGKVAIRRRTYRGQGPGAASSAPLDDACGMCGRYMTPDVEEMAALGAAMLTANEVRELLGKVLPVAPSATAIQSAVRQLGVEFDEKRAEIEDAVARECPLPEAGDVLVASWDGVMVPMRENATAWREAGVSTVSAYRSGEGEPEKLATRFHARAPETGMTSLVEHVARQVGRAKVHRDFREVVVICDGKEAIWKAATKHEVFHDATWVLDFYHASENLMKAAKAVFGDTEQAVRWHAKYRERLQLDPAGCDAARRSMQRYARAMKQGDERQRIVRNAAKYFRDHRDRMRYSDFIARGLPIGSGPVEAAAKNIVQARLKRSGMRWSRNGSQHVLDLRAHLKSGTWEPMWQQLRGAA